MYTYLLVNIFTVVLPLALSFEKRIAYVRKWKYLFPALGAVAFIFIIWDFVFTKLQIWGFSPQYLTGIYIFGLPLEEVLFFFCIPFSCVFIYEIVRYRDNKRVLRNIAKPASLLLAACLLIITAFNPGKVYTSVTFSALGLLLLLLIFLVKPDFMPHFYLAYLFSLIPFFIVNGILTNGIKSIDSGPVVWYNDMHNLSFRIRGIPVEDTMYWMLLFLMNICVYEYLRKKY